MKRGRRSAPSAAPVADVRGLPWNPERALYHATVALGGIRRHGFLTRAQLRARHHGGPVEATGGGTDSMVSFTMDPRIALAIVVGLEVFRRIAHRELSLVALLDQLEVELGPRAVQKAVEHVFATDVAAKRDAVCRGMLRRRPQSPFSFPRPDELPPGSRVIEWWHDVQGMTRGEWEASTYVDPVTREMRHRVAKVSLWEEPLSREDLADVLMSLYKTAIGLSDRAYNPLFWGTRPQAFARVRQRDIGVVVARSAVPFLAPWDVLSLVDLGIIPRTVARHLESFVQIWSNHTREAADPYPWTKPSGPLAANATAGWRCPDQIGAVPFDCETPYLVTPATTMLHLASMREVRIGEVSMVRATRFLPYRGLVRLGVLDSRRLTYPRFVEEPGNFPSLPHGGRAAARKRPRWVLDSEFDVEKHFSAWFDEEAFEIRKPFVDWWAVSWLEPDQDFLDKGIVKDYAGRFRRGQPVAPLFIHEDGEIVDGHHRWAAASRLGIEEAPVVVLWRRLDG